MEISWKDFKFSLTAEFIVAVSNLVFRIVSGASVISAIV